MDERERRRRSMQRRKRIRQRNRRVALAVGLLIFVIVAAVVNVKKDRAREAEKAAAEAAVKAEKQKKKVPEEETEKLVLASEAEKKQWYLKLVNAKNPIKEEDVPETVGIGDDGHRVDKRIKEPLEEMLADAKKAGRSPVIVSSFRKWGKQEALYKRQIDRFMNKEGLDEEEAAVMAATVVAVPGTSEHQIGMAVDIVASDYQELNEKQMETEDQKWLVENCWKYGFILRYPSDKTEMTGVIFEPWHYRYVGEKAAKEITEQGLTLEEYLDEEAVGYPGR